MKRKKVIAIALAALTEDASIVYASDKRNHCLTKYILEGLK